jgi:deoxyribodipyrimidine photo-lyase
VTTAQIIWFRQDLRLTDQAAVAAAATAGPVLPVYVLDDAAPGHWARGGASRWWLHHSLTSLDASLRERGAQLILLKGDAVQQLIALSAAHGSAPIHALEHHEPWARRQQAQLGERLHLYPGLTLRHPELVRTGSGGAFKVFTPFWRALQAMLPPALPTPAPPQLVMADAAPQGDRLGAWQLLPSRPNWAKAFPDYWQPGEAGAAARIAQMAPKAKAYASARDFPAIDATSGLSPHLHFGEVSPAQVWHGVGDAEPLLRQLAWRDFSLGLLHHSPDFPDRNWKRSFDAFPWRNDPMALAAWQRGQTGYPIVDAGMRQLWATGWSTTACA